MQVNIHQAKTHLSALLQRVSAGEEITIARAGVPVARLVSVKSPRQPRVLDMYRGKFEVPEDFDAPLPDEVLALFEGREPKGTSGKQKEPRRSRQ